MGKNLYETPRDKAKWKVSSDKTKGSQGGVRNPEEARKERLEKLKSQFQDRKKHGRG